MSVGAGTTGVPMRTESALTTPMLSLFRCAGVVEDSAAYVSAPITTGARFLRWKVAGRPESTFKSEVFGPNVDAVTDLVLRARKHFDGPVIDPTQLHDVPGWEQRDYHDFWMRVIERDVHTVCFAPGWEYSTGAVWEFATALKHELSLLDDDFEPLNPTTGLNSVGAACEHFDEVGVDTGPLREALAAALAAAEE